MRGNIALNSKLVKIDTRREDIAIHKNDQDGLSVSTSQNAMVKPVKKPYTDPMTTPNGLGFFKNKAMKNRLNKGAINRPFVLAVTSITFPGISGMSKLSSMTIIPNAALLSLMPVISFLNIPRRESIISVISTELAELIPDDRLDIDAENNAAMINPDMPMGN